MTAQVREGLLEIGRGLRWRGQRWRVIGREDGFVRLAGIDAANRDVEVTPLVELELANDAFSPDTPGSFPLEVERTSRPRWRAMHQAYASTMVGARERLVGLDWGAIAVEPYQLVPLMRAARQVAPRLLIADDTGLGKTAEAGLVLRYLAQRHRAGRVLVVTRAAPEPQRWQRELWTKFGLDFDVLRNGADFAKRRRTSVTVNVFAQRSRVIASMTLLSRQVLLDELRQAPAYDVVIVDEAHNVALRGSATKRLTVLARTLAGKVDDGALLLLTATPHDGKTESFLSLLTLLDPYVEVEQGQIAVDVASRLVVRRLKKEVMLAGGRKFVEPEIKVRSTIPDATEEERKLEPLLDEYLSYLAEREQSFRDRDERAKAKGCAFLATVLLKRTGSSVAALRATLRRRLDLEPDEEDADERVGYVETDTSDPEDDELDPAATELTPPPGVTPTEAELAAALLDAAKRVPRGRDAKLEHLSALLRGPLAGQKVVVFTEYRDTLRAAARRLDSEGITYETFHGGTPDAQRTDALRAFQHDAGTLVFLATDAGSEGQNLQHACRDLVHLDVPWNPNRYEQRNGRIDRYGQTKRARIWALVAADRERGQGRPEFRALEVVLEKLEKITTELGSVSPVLPALSGDRVPDLLRHAGQHAEVEVGAMIDDAEADAADRQLLRLAVRNEGETRDAERLVSRLGTVDDFRERVEALLLPAFRGWDDGGRIEEIEPNIVRLQVPGRLRRALGRDEIRRATFLRDIAVGEGEEDREDPAEFLSLGHPLVEATAQALREESTDPAFEHRFDVAASSEPALVVSFLQRFIDGEGRTVEERLEAVRVGFDGDVSDAPEADLALLALDGQPGNTPAGARPDPAAIARWQKRYPELLDAARAEAHRRAGGRLAELANAARHVHEQEATALALWRREQEERAEAETIGIAPQVTLEAAEEYRLRRERLEREYDRQLDSVRDQTVVDVAGVEAIGGLLLVEPAP